jgi:serine phosphatase RsbU (regulator of sigma subunit)/anti-sigma regulatory factor (Ser/Thr protein kinase)
MLSPLIDIAPNDPIIPYFLSSPGTVEIDKLQLESPALRALKEANVKLAVPLVSQGELVGLLNLGPRRSEQDYSTDDRGLLKALAAQASPAVRVAQMVREQQAAALERERIEQELRVARLIQQTLLPKELPELPGWALSEYYMPARFVGGDFYDFIYLEDGRLGIVIGDVTDKGVPAALLMATTRSILRSIAQAGVSPGQVLEQTNNLLHPDIPPKMFVTCLYAILDPRTGLLLYANAGHDLPHRWHNEDVSELRATGMPLGLLPGMVYEEKETTLAPGEGVLFYSDGLVEAHNSTREMFGFPYLKRLLCHQEHHNNVIDYLLDRLKAFTGDDWEQEDDVTLVTLQRLVSKPSEVRISEGEITLMKLPQITSAVGSRATTVTLPPPAQETSSHVLTEFFVPSAPGNERMAMEQVADAIAELHLPKRRLDSLKTAVAEATMNAMEHGNKYQEDVPVIIRVQASPTELSISIRDQGGDAPIPDMEKPDIEAKLAELQAPRGWGLFLIKNLVDDVLITSDATHHTIELIMHLEEARNVNENL